MVTTELNANKVGGADLAEAGLEDLITVLHGDAMETLASGRRAGAVRPCSKRQGGKTSTDRYFSSSSRGCLPARSSVADNTSMPGLQSYLDYVRDPASDTSACTSRPAEASDSMEISCRV